MASSKIYNGFIFFNEFDMLDIRLAELYDVVDYFILVEARTTHRGVEKPPYFNRRKKEYEQYNEKIIHVIHELPDFTGNAWTLENEHRRGIMQGLVKAKPQDYLILTDADEIPRKEAIQDYSGKMAALSMDFFYFKLNMRSPYQWTTAKIINIGNMTNDINHYRQHIGGCDLIHRAGWHFSKCYSIEQTKWMFKNALADDLHHDDIINRLDNMAEIGYTDWCGHHNRFFKCDIDHTYPLHIRQNKDKYKHLIV